MNLNGFILAGGKSTRMGRDKALLDWHGRTLLEHMIALLSSAVDRVQVVGRDHLPDRVPGRGPLSGIATALQATDADANLLVAVDLPLLTENFLKSLRSRLEISKHLLVACKIGSDFPLCLGVRQSLLPEIQNRITRGDLSIKGFIEACPAEIISEAELVKNGVNLEIFKNMNTPEEYKSAWSSSVPDVK